MSWFARDNLQPPLIPLPKFDPFGEDEAQTLPADKLTEHFLYAVALLFSEKGSLQANGRHVTATAMTYAASGRANVLVTENDAFVRRHDGTLLFCHALQAFLDECAGDQNPEDPETWTPEQWLNSDNILAKVVAHSPGRVLACLRAGGPGWWTLGRFEQTLRKLQEAVDSALVSRKPLLWDRTPAVEAFHDALRQSQQSAVDPERENIERRAMALLAWLFVTRNQLLLWEDPSDGHRVRTVARGEVLKKGFTWEHKKTLEMVVGLAKLPAAVVDIARFRRTSRRETHIEVLTRQVETYEVHDRQRRPRCRHNCDSNTPPPDSNHNGNWVHCEMKMLYHLVDNMSKAQKDMRAGGGGARKPPFVPVDFIGCSKLCCERCWRVIRKTPFRMAGRHGGYARHWVLPSRLCAWIDKGFPVSAQGDHEKEEKTVRVRQTVMRCIIDPAPGAPPTTSDGSSRSVSPWVESEVGGLVQTPSSFALTFSERAFRS